MRVCRIHTSGEHVAYSSWNRVSVRKCIPKLTAYICGTTSSNVWQYPMLTVTGKILTRSYEHTMERLCRSYFTRSTCTSDKMIKWVVLLMEYRFWLGSPSTITLTFIYTLVYATLMMIISYMETLLHDMCEDGHWSHKKYLSLTVNWNENIMQYG